MAGAIVQSAYNKDDTGATSLTIAVTINGVVAGNHLVVHVGHGTTAQTTTGVNDGAAYANAGAQVDDVGNGQSGQIWYLENSSGGNKTVTATFSLAVTSRRIRVFEVSGLVKSGSLDQVTGQAQTNPGTGANAVSSGASAATTNANDFVMGFTQDTAEVDPGSGTLTAGAGFTISGANLILGGESKSVTATGAQTATFTTSVAANDYVTHVVAFKEAVAAAGATNRLFSNPGAGPFMAARFAEFIQGISPPAPVTVSNQPVLLWPKTPAPDFPDEDLRRANHHSLLTRQIVLVGITINYTVEVPDFASAEWIDTYEVQKHSLQPFRWYAPTVSGRWPWYLWRPALLPLEAEEEIRRPDSTILHRYRQAFQTVGQSYRLWSIAKVRLEPEDYAQTRPADLSPFRKITPATPTAVQPFFVLWTAPRLDWEIEVLAPRANHELLHRYRFAFQTVGQSWQYWVKPQARIDDEPNAPARIPDLSPFRTTAPTVQPGQPWFMFPTAEPDLTVEPDAVRTDHAAALYPFRPHPETTPTPVTIELLPAGRHKKYRYFVEIDDQQFQVDSPQEAVLILLQAQKLAPISAERAAKLVLRKQLKRKRRPQINLKPPRIETNAPLHEQLASIRSDIEAIYRDVAITQELAYLFRKQLQIEQDDDEDVILLLH